MHNSSVTKRTTRRKLRLLQRNAFKKGISLCIMKEIYVSSYNPEIKKTKKRVIVAIVTVFVFLVISGSWLYSVLGERCLVPSNYLVWEATRPLADCAYCENVTKPIILRNATRRSFAVRLYFI